MKGLSSALRFLLSKIIRRDVWHQSQGIVLADHFVLTEQHLGQVTAGERAELEALMKKPERRNMSRAD